MPIAFSVVIGTERVVADIYHYYVVTSITVLHVAYGSWTHTNKLKHTHTNIYEHL